MAYDGRHLRQSEHACHDVQWHAPSKLSYHKLYFRTASAATLQEFRELG
jgi:hypothetical protein